MKIGFSQPKKGVNVEEYWKHSESNTCLFSDFSRIVSLAARSLQEVLRLCLCFVLRSALSSRA